MAHGKVSVSGSAYVKLFVVYLFMGPFILTFDPVCKIFNTEFLNVYR